MQYELSAEIIKILDDLAERFGIAIDWADKNVMPYLIDLYERFIDYKIVLNIIPVILFVVVLVIGIIFIKNLFKYKNLAKQNKKSNLFFDVESWGIDISYFTCISGIFLIFVFVGTTIFTVCSIDTLLELIFIPEVYMVEYLSNLMQ